jgi:heterodisulfide reductase subunit A-like polyferredoxin
MSSECDTTHHLVVGAGICGTIVAYSYAKAGVPVVVFDREVDLGGIWNKSLSIAKVNSESRPQIDPVIFRLPEDDTLVQFITGEFGGIWSTPDRVVEQVRAMKESQNLKIF